MPRAGLVPEVTTVIGWNPVLHRSVPWWLGAGHASNTRIRGRNIHRLLFRRGKHYKQVRQTSQQRNKRKFNWGGIYGLLHECHDFRCEPFEFSWVCWCFWSYLWVVCTYYSPEPAIPMVKAWDTKGMDYNLRIPCIHEVLMLCSGAIWHDYLNLPKFLLAPFVAGG